MNDRNRATAQITGPRIGRTVMLSGGWECVDCKRSIRAGRKHEYETRCVQCDNLRFAHEQMDALRAERDEAVKAAKYASDTGVRDRIARRKAEAEVVALRADFDRNYKAYAELADTVVALRAELAEANREIVRLGVVRDGLIGASDRLEAEVERMRPVVDKLRWVEENVEETEGRWIDDVCDVLHEYDTASDRATSEQEATDALLVGQDERVDRMMEAD